MSNKPEPFHPVGARLRDETVITLHAAIKKLHQAEEVQGFEGRRTYLERLAIAEIADALRMALAANHPLAPTLRALVLEFIS